MLTTEVGPHTVRCLNRYLNNGLELHGGKDNLGFLFLYELLSGSFQMRVMTQDSSFFLACLLMRMLPPSEAQIPGVLMSLLRMFANNEDLANQKSLPHISEKKGLKAKTMFHGMDNIFSRLMRKIRPWVEQKHREEDIDWPEPSIVLPAEAGGEQKQRKRKLDLMVPGTARAGRAGAGAGVLLKLCGPVLQSSPCNGSSCRRRC